MKNNYKIYALSSSENPNEFKYIGYTKKEIEQRLKEHMYSYRQLKTHKDKWFNQQINMGFEILTQLLESDIPESNVDSKEIFYIKKFKDLGFKLTNSNDGGIGGGKNPSLETKKKISEKNKGKTPRKGAILSEETKNKIRIKRIGTKASEETKTKISNAGLNRKHSEETKTKMSINSGRYNKDKKYDNERVLKMVENSTFKKPVIQYSLDNIFISEFNSIAEASKILNINKDSISKCCRKRTKSGGNYIWEFKNKDDIKPSNTATNIKKPVMQYSLDNIFLKEYGSITEAVKSTNGHKNHISECCKGKAMSSGGFIWRYKN